MAKILIFLIFFDAYEVPPESLLYMNVKEKQSKGKDIVLSRLVLPFPKLKGTDSND